MERLGASNSEEGHSYLDHTFEGRQVRPQPNCAWGQIPPNWGHASLPVPRSADCSKRHESVLSLLSITLGLGGAGQSLHQRWAQGPPVYSAHIGCPCASVPVAFLSSGGHGQCDQFFLTGQLVARLSLCPHLSCLWIHSYST